MPATTSRMNANPDLEQHDGLLFPLGIEFVKASEYLDRRLDPLPHGADDALGRRKLQTRRRGTDDLPIIANTSSFLTTTSFGG
jgi:hypothetical protein